MNQELDQLTDKIMARCDALAQCSEESGWLTRTFLRPPMRQVHELLSKWMGEAGLTVRRDALGNVIGRRPGWTDRIFAVGSHVDTVPNAGKYDGVLGVLLGIAAAQALGSRPDNRTLDVIAFSEEEGVRFRSPYLGSKAVCGRFDQALLQRKDMDGISIAQALTDFGLDPTQIASAAYPPDQLVGYLEAHIEQGPVLDSMKYSLGIVTAIAGQSRLWVTFEGKAGHAGTQPMELRRDALTAAAEFIIAVEQAARKTADLRATVGRCVVQPGATNVVPGEVLVSLDVRHVDDEARRSTIEQLQNSARFIGDTRKIKVIIKGNDLDESAVKCDAIMSDRLSAVVTSTGNEPYKLVSGAGHDAVVMATRCPVAMLFLRNPGGISHHPDESVRKKDVRAALDVMIRFLGNELNLE